MKKTSFILQASFSILFAWTSASAQASDTLVKISGPAFVNDLRYNSEQNFLKKNVYKDFGLDACFVQQDMYSALQKLEKLLIEKKLKLVFWDCWRPLSVQQAMWKLVPDSRYVANPKTGSNHNRGIAIDVTLAKEDGTSLEMPTPFDDFTPKAAAQANCSVIDKIKCENRDLLIQLMAQVGLKPVPSEWWHYQVSSGAKKYPIIPDFPK